MSLTQDEREALLHWMSQARDDPRRYRVRVGARAVAAYALLLFALGIAVAGVLASVWLIVVGLWFFIPIYGPVIVAIFALVFVEIMPPREIELRPADAPVLVETIARLCTQLDAPRVRVLLGRDFNTRIIQEPRLGPFGWQRTYLRLGIASMHALSRQELEAVIARELALVSRRHDRFGMWIIRLRNNCECIGRELVCEWDVWGAWAVARVYSSFALRLGICAVALQRAHERESDRLAAEAVGARHAARALVRMAALAPAAADYWEAVDLCVSQELEPPFGLSAGLAKALRDAPVAAGATAARRALATPVAPTDTRLSLSERLAVLGPRSAALDIEDVLRPPPVSAAHALLGTYLYTSLCERLSADVREQLRPGWVSRRAEVPGASANYAIRTQLHGNDAF